MSIDRYSTEMSTIFNDRSRVMRWADVEIALLKAHVAVGNVPKNEIDLNELINARNSIDLKRVAEIEEQIHHDLMAVVKALAEKAPKSGKYLHIGATSYDIEDTATALAFKEAFALITKEITHTLKILKKLAQKHVNTVCIGRTHGQHAIPTTYGMKFALYYDDFVRCKQRIEDANKRIFVGKMSGAVGTMAGFGGKGIKIEQLVMKQLGLKPARICNQVVQRDIHAEAIITLALIASCAEKIAKEIRNLQRTDIGEVLEGFSKKQVGSSTMPHKRNPHKSERICSLSRLIRNNVSVALENIALEHERDLTNSANERFIIPQTFILTHYIIKQLNNVLENLVVFEEKALENLWKTKGLVFAERVMLALSAKGMDRQEAHEIVRTLAQECYATGKDFKQILKNNIKIVAILKNEEIESIFDPTTYLGNHKEIIKRALANNA